MPGDQPKSQDLVKVLIDNKVISSAQAQLAIADQEVTGMAMEDVLMARGWVTQATLDQYAPWLQQRAPKHNTVVYPSDERSYEESLREYRRLMERILGTNWD